MRRRFRFVAIALAFALGRPFAARADAERLAWIASLKDALLKAGETGKPVLMDVWAVWCVPCKAMDDTTYADAAFTTEARGFVLSKIDADVQVPVIRRYGIEAYPTILFLDAEGTEIARLAGYVKPADLAARMRAVREGYDRYAAYRRGSGDEAFVADYLLAAGNAGGAVEHYRRAVDGLAGEPDRREAEEMKLAQALRGAGQDRRAEAIFDRISRSSGDRSRRGAALQALIKTQIAMGKRKDAEASFARLAKEYPELARDVRAAIGNSRPE